MEAKRVFTALSALTTLASTALAIPFDSTAGGPAVATVGSGGDYASLAAAAAAFSAVTPSIEREWTLLITGDLTESSAAYFGNAFGLNGKLIIKPAPATQPVVRFQIPSAPVGIYGDLVIGLTNGAAPGATNDRASNGNYVLDGSNAPGGTSRDLTFMVPPQHDDPMQRVIRIWGDNHGVVIKNLNVLNYDSGLAGHCIGLAAGSVGGVSKSPKNTLIENCHLHAEPIGSSSGFGVESSTSAYGSMLPPDTMSITIRGCQIEAKHRGILLTHNDALIEDNDVLVTSGTATTFTYTGIATSNVVTGNLGTLTIRNNRIRLPNIPTTSPGQGAVGIMVDAATSVAVVEVYNNLIPEMSFSSALPADLVFRAISCTPNANASTHYLIEHNSIRADASTVVTAATAGRAAGVSFLASVSPIGGAQLRNNLIVFREADGNAAAVFLSSGANVGAEGNDIVSPRAIGRVGPTDYLSFSAWQSAGFDSVASGGQSVDPALTTPAWDEDLHFAYKPIAGLATVASSTVHTDVDGDPRPATGALPGADEPVLNAGIADWPLF
ncbi:MAG: hypothetical protein D6691_00600 [Candidatus Hydrogenedentota bacterium]|nr:MAG: hypothetical protein D6691_00600 [Candidatus Hydrogenedentota bacterium]GIX44950.1 MAG: hypothetical protein KatS3mg130_1358 [Candidatus Sumerlaea sp.]